MNPNSSSPNKPLFHVPETINFTTILPWRVQTSGSTVAAFETPSDAADYVMSDAFKADLATVTITYIATPI